MTDQAESAAPAAFADYAQQRLGQLKERYPEVHEKLLSALDELSNADSAEDYQDVGLRCRDAIILFADAIYSPDFVAEGEDPPKDGDAKTRIELTLKHFGRLAGTDTLRDLVRSCWAYSMRVQHNIGSTSDDAQRAALLTTVTIIELAILVEEATKNTAWMEQYGVYKCPTCGSSDLYEDTVVDDFDASGFPRWHRDYLSCRQCPWSSLFK